jgi:signal transduction histidine kinase
MAAPGEVGALAGDAGSSDERLEAAARAAARIAHDMNNLLTAVGGFIEIARTRVGAAHPAEGPLQEAGRALDRGSERIRRLQAFARTPEVRPVPLDLVAFARDRRLAWTARAGGSHPLALEMEATPILVRADPALLDTATEALLQNAVEAGPPGRPVVVSVGPDRTLSVRDEGPGISAEARARLFEPFFTTKPRAEHLGLGLATARRLLLRLGGEVRVEPGPPGVTVTIALPPAL